MRYIIKGASCIIQNVEEFMDLIHFIDDKIAGSKVWKGNLNLFNIVLIGLPKSLDSVPEERNIQVINYVI